MTLEFDEDALDGRQERAVAYEALALQTRTKEDALAAQRYRALVDPSTHLVYKLGRELANPRYITDSSISETPYGSFGNTTSVMNGRAYNEGVSAIRKALYSSREDALIGKSPFVYQQHIGLFDWRRQLEARYYPLPTTPSEIDVVIFRVFPDHERMHYGMIAGKILASERDR